LCGQPYLQRGWSVKQHRDNKVSTKPLHAWKTQMSDLAIRLVTLYFRDMLEDYGYEVVDTPVSSWKRMDRSEDLNVYIANRLLFTKPVRKLI
jgi:hypothetical protein